MAKHFITLPAPVANSTLSAHIETSTSQIVVADAKGKRRETAIIGTLVFTGAPTGEARVHLFAKTLDGTMLHFESERALEHWAGYVANAGARLYCEGDQLHVPLGFMHTFKIDRVLKQGLRVRGRVAYRGPKGKIVWGSPRYFNAPTFNATTRSW